MIYCLLMILLITITSGQTIAQELVIPLRGLPKTFNPQDTRDVYSMVLMLQLHRGLLRFQSDLSIKPDLAESFEVSQNGKTITFILAPRTFSNSIKEEPVRAIHVVRSFQRMFIHKTGLAADMSYIVGAKTIMLGDHSLRAIKSLGVKTIDDKTVVFSLEKPASTFLLQLASVDAAILPFNSQLQFNGLTDGGAGPYFLKELSNDKIIIQARDFLFKTHPKAPKTIRIFSPSTALAIALAIKGSVQSLDGFPVDKKSLMELKNKGWHASVSTVTRQISLVLNPKLLPYSIRSAISASLSPVEFKISSHVKLFGLIPDGLPGGLKIGDKVFKLPEPQVRKKKYTLKYLTDDEGFSSIASLIQIYLAKLNIEVALKPISVDEYTKGVNTKDYDMMLRARFLEYPDGLAILNYFRSNSDANSYFIHDTGIDLLLDAALVELDSEKRMSLYKQIQLQVLKHEIVVPLVSGSDNLGLWHPSVKNVKAHPLGLQSLAFETLEIN